MSRTTGDITLLTDGVAQHRRRLVQRRRQVRCTARRDEPATTSTSGSSIRQIRSPTSCSLSSKAAAGRRSIFRPTIAKLLAINRLSVNESYLWLVDVATRQEDAAHAESWDSRRSPTGRPVQPRRQQDLYVTTDRDSEFHRLASIDLANQKHTYLTDRHPLGHQQFELSWDGKTIAFVSNEDGRDVLHLLDTATGKELPKPEMPVGIIGGLHMAQEQPRPRLQFPRLPPRVRRVFARCTTGKARAVDIQRNRRHQHRRLHRRPSSSAGNRSTAGRSPAGSTSPPAKFTGKRPVIIQIHGGPEGQARPWLGAGNSYLVNELGIAIIQPNVRGSPGYGKTFLTLDNGFKREDSYKDIGSLLDWIKTRDDLDADRIMVTGGSYGGHMTLAVATQYADRIRCALDVVGPSTW